MKALKVSGTRSFYRGTRQERMPLKSERNEAGTDASKIRGTQKGTARSFSVPFASKFGQIFSKFSIFYAKIGRNTNILIQNIYFIMKCKSCFEKYATIQIYLRKLSHSNTEIMLKRNGKTNGKRNAVPLPRKGTRQERLPQIY